MSSPLIARAPCPAGDPLRVGVLVSGSGSNLQAILDAARASTARFRVATVVSNVAGVRALERASAAGIPSAVIDHRGRARPEFESAVHAELVAKGAEIVVLAGFMRVLTSSFLERWPRLVVNVHPALCPAFPGMHAAKQALDHGARITGCTVHLVDAGVDTGPILAQAAVPILDSDSEPSLQSRIQIEEHRLLPAVIDAMAKGKVLVDGSRLRVSL